MVLGLFIPGTSWTLLQNYIFTQLALLNVHNIVLKKNLVMKAWR
jgi:hypothetical protein